MSTHVIPINPITQEFIGAVLNDGVVPDIEEFNTYFKFDTDPDVPNEILDPNQYLELVAGSDWKKGFVIETV